MISHLLVLSRQQELPDWKNSRFHMSLQIVITAYVLLVEQSTKMIICLAFFLCKEIRRYVCTTSSGGYSTSSPVKCCRRRKDDPWFRFAYPLWCISTMAMGEGGPELVKQLLNRTYDIAKPGVVAIYLTGKPQKGVGPQDIALAIIGAVFDNGYVKNKVMEFCRRWCCKPFCRLSNRC